MRARIDFKSPSLIRDQFVVTSLSFTRLITLLLLTMKLLLTTSWKHIDLEGFQTMTKNPLNGKCTHLAIFFLLLRFFSLSAICSEPTITTVSRLIAMLGTSFSGNHDGWIKRHHYYAREKSITLK